jgi:hypothetical protein
MKVTYLNNEKKLSLLLKARNRQKLLFKYVLFSLKKSISKDIARPVTSKRFVFVTNYIFYMIFYTNVLHFQDRSPNVHRHLLLYPGSRNSSPKVALS